MDHCEHENPARRPGSVPGRTGAAAARSALEALRATEAPDPEWWVRRMAKREQYTGALAPALSLRVEDARLDEAIDRERTEAGVRAIIDEFNRRVCEARRALLGGPPVITPTRDADREVELWLERRSLRRKGA